MSSNKQGFMFLPKHWLSSPKIMLMTPAQEGAYIRLLSICWDANGLPDDDKTLAKLSRLEENWEESKEILRSCFYKKNGKLHNKRLDIEAQKLAKTEIDKAHPVTCYVCKIQFHGQAVDDRPPNATRGRYRHPLCKPESKPKKEKDPLWDAIMTVCGYDSDSITPNLASRIGKVKKELLNAKKPWTPEEILKLPEAMKRLEWFNKKEYAITPEFIAKHITEVRIKRDDWKQTDPRDELSLWKSNGEHCKYCNDSGFVQIKWRRKTRLDMIKAYGDRVKTMKQIEDVPCNCKSNAPGAFNPETEKPFFAEQ